MMYRKWLAVKKSTDSDRAVREGVWEDWCLHWEVERKKQLAPERTREIALGE